jgi:hypothetical protein
VIRTTPTDGQRAEVEQRLAQGERSGAIGYRVGLHRRDVEAIARDALISSEGTSDRPTAGPVHPVARATTGDRS